LDEPTCGFFAKGRHALWHGIRGAGLGRRGDEILVPAFNCGSEIEALVHAEIEPRFYEATETLKPDPDELEALLGPRTRALFLIHYLGFPQDSARWRTWCDERGLLLIEDCAHVWDAVVDGRPIGSYGDIAIYSLSKTLGLPGGLLVSKRPSGVAPPSESRDLLQLLKMHAGGVATRFGWTPPEHRNPFPQVRQLAFSAPHPLAFDRPRGAPPGTRFLLGRMDLSSVSSRRRSNYERLLSAFAERVPTPFGTLFEGASPLVFPIAVAEPAGVSARLRSLGIAARPWWSHLHPSLPAETFPRAVAWHERFIVLPVHQGLRPQDVERIRQALRTL
jgi:dTDP-4-amino-4,6-dideoxygalactose transaminase